MTSNKSIEDLVADIVDDTHFMTFHGTAIHMSQDIWDHMGKNRIPGLTLANNDITYNGVQIVVIEHFPPKTYFYLTIFETFPKPLNSVEEYETLEVLQA